MLSRPVPTAARPVKSSLAMMAAGLGLSTILLYFAFRHLDWAALTEKVEALPAMNLGLSLLLVVGHGFLMAEKWRVVLIPVGRVGFETAYWSLRISYFINATLPAKLGEPIRIWFVRQRSRLSLGHLLGALGSDRLVDVGTLVILAFAATFFLNLQQDWLSWKWPTAIFLIIVVAFLILNRLRFTSTNPWLRRFSEQLEKIREGLLVLKRGHVVARAIAYSIAGWAFHTAIVFSLAQGLGYSLELSQAYVVVAAVSLAVAIPSTPSNFGPFEFACIFVLKDLFGYSLEAAASVALLYHFSQLIPTWAIGALGLILFKKDLLPQIRKIRKEERSA